MKIIIILFSLIILSTLAACGATDNEGAVVTFLVAGREEYKIQITNPADIATARDILAGNLDPRIPNGIVVRGSADVNSGYSWHIDPESFEFADMTTEVCDGLPSDVENKIITSDYYCPWSTEIVAVD